MAVDEGPDGEARGLPATELVVTTRGRLVENSLNTLGGVAHANLKLPFEDTWKPDFSNLNQNEMCYITVLK